MVEFEWDPKKSAAIEQSTELNLKKFLAYSTMIWLLPVQIPITMKIAGLLWEW